MCVDNCLYVMYNLIMGKEWSDIIKARMRIQKVTQDQIGEHLGVTKGAVSHWLNGRREPGIKEIAKMLAMVGIKKFLVNHDGEITLENDNDDKEGKPDLTPEQEELLTTYSSLPADKKEKFLREMKAMKAHYDAYFEQRLRETQGKAS